jgi:uncharacterized protein YpmS
MKKVIFRKDQPDFDKHRKRLAFDGLLEQKRQKDRKRLKWNMLVLIIEVLLVLILAYIALSKLSKQSSYHLEYKENYTFSLKKSITICPMPSSLGRLDKV